MSALDDLQEALHDARTEAARLRIELSREREAGARLRRLVDLYGLGVSCSKCGVMPMWPCISDRGRVTVHSLRVSKAAAAQAEERP